MTRSLVLLCLLLCTGCVKIGLGEAVVVSEAPLENKRKQILSKRVTVKVEQDETLLTVTAERLCDVEDRARVEQTLARERVNQSPGVTWQLGIYGTILAGVGTGVVIDAQLNVEDSDPAGQNYNAIGPEAATAIGVAFFAAAAPMLVIAIVDGLRATGTEEQVTEIEQSRGIIERGTTCLERVPVASAPVIGKTRGGTQLALGNTNFEGTLEVELTEAVSRDVTLKEGAMSLALFMGDQRIGMANLKPVAEEHREAEAEREDKVWAALDPDACEDGSAKECHALEEFLKEYPHSAHAPEARAALEKGNAKIAAREAAAQRERERQAAAAAAAAEERRKKEEAARACRQRCSTGCNGNPQCINACVAAKCQ